MEEDDLQKAREIISQSTTRDVCCDIHAILTGILNKWEENSGSVAGGLDDGKKNSISFPGDYDGDIDAVTCETVVLTFSDAGRIVETEQEFDHAEAETSDIDPVPDLDKTILLTPSRLLLPGSEYEKNEPAPKKDHSAGDPEDSNLDKTIILSPGQVSDSVPGLEPGPGQGRDRGETDLDKTIILTPGGVLKGDS